ncbi:MAG: IS982 family transposase, partial [Prevotellaceae bacterium]|nr:IS982 family transposase [Prevotellaceae bacterium]
MSILTDDKITGIFCIVYDFCKELSKELTEIPKLEAGGTKHRNRPCTMSESEIITILLLYHFGSFKNFKHYYLHYICVHLKQKFPNALSYNRFIQIEHRVFMPMMFFLNTVCFGKCTGISFIDSTKIAVCHNKRIKRNKVFKGFAKRGKSTLGWF